MNFNDLIKHLKVIKSPKAYQKLSELKSNPAQICIQISNPSLQ